MLILGITGGHDANWCLLRDGTLLGAFEKERFTRRRHDVGEVLSHIPETLARLGLTPDDIDMVATSEPVWKGTAPGHRLLSGDTYGTIDTWEHQTVELFDRVLPCVSLPHHLAHAAYARYTGTADRTAVITWDGGGDFYTEDAYTSTSVSLWSGNQLEWIERVPNCDAGSLWFTYSRAVFGDPHSAGKLMGLAALGGGSLKETVTERFSVRRRERFDHMMAVKECWPDYEDPPFVHEGMSWSDRRAQDLAAAVQHLTERSGLSIAERVRGMTGASHLAVAGGVSLNGYLNTALQRSGLYDSVWVPPAVDDGGLSVGCAMFTWHHVLGGEFRPDPSFDWARVGMWYDESDVRMALEGASGLVHHRVDLEEAVQHTAAELARSEAVAWVEGRAEHGPRALGNRSILSPATEERHRTMINGTVKFRESFRPLAPVTTMEHAPDYFDIDGESPYMMHIVPCTEKAEQEIPAAVHHDRTARVQTVAKDQSVARIVDAFAGLGFPPVLINTSFNIREPIVNSPQHAVDTFSRSPLNSMYLDGFLVRKEGGA